METELFLIRMNCIQTFNENSGHVDQMAATVLARKAFDDGCHGKCKPGKLKLRWKDKLVKDVNKLRVTNWKSNNSLSVNLF